MPATSTFIFSAAAFASISPIAAFAGATGWARSMSLAPSSTISASPSGGTLQSKRASASSAVSPETPALTTSTSKPAGFERGAELLGKALAGLQPIARRQAVAQDDKLERPRLAPAPTPECDKKRDRLDEARDRPI